MPELHDTCRRASGFGAFGACLLALLLACGEDDPTGLGRELRTHPDSLHALDLPDAWRDSVYSLPVSLRSSGTGQIGSQRPYTSQILYDFRVPTFAVDEAETLRLDAARFEITLTKQSEPPFTGGMRLALGEVARDERGWSRPAVYDSTVLTHLPTLRPGFVADEIILVGDSLTTAAPGLELAVAVRRLADYDSVVATLDTLEVNVALVFLGFASGGPGFVEFTQISASGQPLPRFIGNYRAPMSGTTGIEVPVAPQKQLVVVEFDSTYTTGTNWVVSDAHRFHTFFEFPDLRSLPDSVLPRAAIVHRADLILFQADAGEEIFGPGVQTLGVIVPSDAVLADSALVFSTAENNRSIAFQDTITTNPGGQFSLAITTYLFDQQEGTVVNRGMILRLANEGRKARQFVFHGPSAADPGLRPRLRLLYALPSDFGGE